MRGNKLIELTDYQKEILVGTLLGDGCIEKSHKSSNGLLAIVRSSEDLGLLIWESKIFENLASPANITSGPRFDKRTNRSYERSLFRTRSNPVFKSYESDWYKIIDAKRFKVVPRDLCLTDTIVAKWIADDGSIRKHEVVDKSRYTLDLKISTHGFLKEDTLFLRDSLNEKYKCNFVAVEEKDNWYLLLLRREEVFNFLKQIDSSWIWPMDRKSSLWRSENYKLITLNQKPSCKNCGTMTRRNGYWFKKGVKMLTHRCPACNINQSNEV